MGTQLMVQDATAKGQITGEMLLGDLPDRITVRDLIRTRVREEVARYNLETSEYFRGLVCPEGAEEALAGYRMRIRRTIDWEKQAKAAEEGFLANRFFLLVGDSQVTELDDELKIDADTHIRFIKLLPLVGG